MNVCDPQALRALLARHGFHFAKSKGQNFLIDPQIPAGIAAASQADASCGVLEIGPGAGCLTAELARRAGRVVSVELDAALLPVLAETVPYPNVEVLHADVLTLDLEALVREKFSGLTPIVCANLPYNITTPVLTKLAEVPAFQSITVLLQREVARRLAAPSGSGDGGAFTLFLQYHMETALLFDVPPDRFLPPPKVHSAVLRCVRRRRPAVETEDPALFFRLIRGAFLLRRKTLVNSLSAAFPELDKADIAAAVTACGLPPSVRGERLSLEDFARLTAVVSGSLRKD